MGNKKNDILDERRLDFFMYLAYLMGCNVEYANDIMRKLLSQEDIPLLIEREAKINKQLEEDFYLYKGYNFRLYLDFLLSTVSDAQIFHLLISLENELKQLFEINNLKIYSPRVN